MVLHPTLHLWQYQIAQQNVMTLVEAEAAPTFAEWNNAVLEDLLNNQEEEDGERVKENVEASRAAT